MLTTFFILVNGETIQSYLYNKMISCRYFYISRFCQFNVVINISCFPLLGQLYSIILLSTMWNLCFTMACINIAKHLFSTWTLVEALNFKICSSNTNPHRPDMVSSSFTLSILEMWIIFLSLIDTLTLIFLACRSHVKRRRHELYTSIETMKKTG